MKQGPIKIISGGNKRDVDRVFLRRALRMEDAEATVTPIIQAVIHEGDAALVRYAKQWDGFQGKASGLLVPRNQIAAAQRAVGASFLRAVRDAAKNIRAFC